MNIAKLAGVVAATLLASFVLQTREASAATPPYGPKSSNYQVKFVKAYDPCTGPGVTVVNPGGVAACPRANVSTSPTTFTQAAIKISVSKSKGASLQLKGKGFPAATQVGVQLTVRTTNNLTGASDLTYTDQTIICGPAGPNSCKHTVADANGKVKSGKVFLETCMTNNGLPTRLAHGNIEILDSAIIDCATGLTIGTPGIQQP